MNKYNILIAADSYKGSLSSIEVANSIEEGILRVTPDAQVTKLPIADGGEGTVESLTKVLDGTIKELPAKDTFMRDSKGLLGLVGDKAIIECASPVGLDKLDPDELDPMEATSYGVGQMILHALDLNVKEIYIGIGGSSTNDGGIGMAMALGAKILDDKNESVPLGAKGLPHVEYIDISQLDPRIKDTQIHILGDVKNPLTGTEGATYIYGPQKGVTKDQLPLIDGWMESYGQVLERTFNRKVIDLPGSGAAGGLGAALMCYLGGKMHFGIDKILDMINITDYMKRADLVITGEGSMDRQSKYGKAPVGIAKLAKEYDLPVIAIVGAYDPSVIELYSEGIDMVVSAISKPMSLSEAMNNAYTNVADAAMLSYKTFTLWSKE